MYDPNAQVNMDVTSITRVLRDFAAEWRRIADSIEDKIEGPHRMHELAAEADAIDAAWKQQLTVAPPAGPITANPHTVDTAPQPPANPATPATAQPVTDQPVAAAPASAIPVAATNEPANTEGNAAGSNDTVPTDSKSGVPTTDGKVSTPDTGEQNAPTLLKQSPVKP